MSGFIDETFNAVEAVGTTLLTVAALPITIAGGAITLVVSGLSNVIKDGVQRYQIAQEEKRIKETLLKNIETSKNINETQKRKYIDSVIENTNWDNIQLNKSELKSIINNVTVLKDISNINYYMHKLGNLFFDLNDEGVDVSTLEGEYFKITSDIKNHILKGNDISKTSNMLQTFYNKSLSEIKQIIRSLNQTAVNKFENELFLIENQTDNPIYYNISTDMKEFIFKSVISNDKETLESKYLDLIKEISIVHNLFNELEFVKDFDKIINVISSIEEISKNDIDLSSKVSLINERLVILIDEYKKQSVIHEKTLELKQIYDMYFAEITHYAIYLKEPKPAYDFNNNTTQKTLDKMEVKLKEMFELYQIRESNKLARKEIRDALNQLQYKYISTEKTNNKLNSVRDIYHISKGNVVIVTTSDKGNVLYQVQGVKLDGISENKNDIVNSMEEFCADKLKMDVILNERGIEITQKERMEPNIIYANEITLPSNTSIENLTFIRNEKNKTSRQHTVKKEREI